MKKGTKIRFLRTLDAPANEDHPAIEYAHHNETGEIVEVGGCREGFWAKTDNWPNAFGCEAKDFEVIKNS